MDLLSQKHRDWIKTSFLGKWGRIFKLFWRISLDRKLPSLAQSLAYTTILSLVPIFAIFFFVLGEITENSEVQSKIKEFISIYFFPEHASSLFKTLEEFTANSMALGVIGIPMLFLAGVFLYVKVDSSINAIWVSQIERKWFKNGLAFFMTLFLGPMILVLIFSIPPYLQSLPYIQDILRYESVSSVVTELVPIGISTVGLMVLYLYIPATPVKFYPAFWGAFWGALLVQGSNKLVSGYLKYFSRFDVVYGSLAIVPIILLWVFVIWLVVLLGATLTYIFQFHRETDYHVFGEVENDESLLCSALQILLYISKSFTIRNSAPGFDQIQLMLGMNRKRLAHILRILQQEGLVTCFVHTGEEGVRKLKYQPGISPKEIEICSLIPLFYNSREPVVFDESINQLLMNLEVHPVFFHSGITIDSLLSDANKYLCLFTSDYIDYYREAEEMFDTLEAEEERKKSVKEKE